MDGKGKEYGDGQTILLQLPQIRELPYFPHVYGRKYLLKSNSIFGPH